MAQTIRGELTGMIEAIPEIVEKVLAWCERIRFGESLKDLYVLGSGMNFGTAQEGQLKLMETMCIPTMFNDIGEFSHGMHRSITENSSLLLLRARDAFAPLMANTFKYLKTITDHVLMLDATGEEQSDPDCISLPYFPETQSLLLTTLAIQVLSVYAPERMGKDPNREANDEYTSVVQTRIK